MKERARAAIDWVVGIGLLIAGIAGWILPIVPGWLLVIPGLAVLSRRSKLAKRWYERAKRFVAEKAPGLMGRKKPDEAPAQEPESGADR